MNSLRSSPPPRDRPCGSRLTTGTRAACGRDGYVVIKGGRSGKECGRLEEAISADGGIEAHAYGRDDGLGRKTRMALWNHPGNDVTGMIARVPKVRRRSRFAR